MNHFGIEIKPGKFGYKLERMNYAIINNRNTFGFKFDSMKEYYLEPDGRFYSDEWCHKQRENALKNFDVNMEHFESLNPEEFKHLLNAFLKKYAKFKEVFDLKQYDSCEGFYLLVLDEYKQVYIGQTRDIKRRIKSHWNGMKSFDSLLCPFNAIEKSVMSIDCFRSLDTTQIFAYKTPNHYSNENKFLEFFPKKFVCNRIGGDIRNDDPLALVKALSTMNTRNKDTLK